MANLFRKILKWIVLTIIIVSLPTAAIYFDYNNDIQQDQNTIFTYSLTISPENSTQSLILGDLPRLTDISVFINRTSPGNSVPVNYYLMNPSEFSSFDNTGDINDQVKQTQINEAEATTWLNLTTSLEGIFRLVIVASQIDSTVETNGFYRYTPPNYLDRKLFEIVVWIGMYIIVVFGIIPKLIRRYKINRLKKRKQEELMAEEDEFYQKLEQEI